MNSWWDREQYSGRWWLNSWGTGYLRAGVRQSGQIRPLSPPATTILARFMRRCQAPRTRAEAANTRQVKLWRGGTRYRFYWEQTIYAFLNIQFVSHLNFAVYPLILCNRIKGLSTTLKWTTFKTLTYTTFNLTGLSRASHGRVDKATNYGF